MRDATVSREGVILRVCFCGSACIPEERREMIGISPPITVKGLPEALHWLE